MTACSHGGSSVPLLPRGVRRVLDAMRANAVLADISGVSGEHCSATADCFVSVVSSQTVDTSEQ
jgi:hypothetical protein